MEKLSPRRARFVEEYLIDLNPRAAAARAGYKADGWCYIGYNLLKMPEVAAAVREAMDERARRLELSADLVVRELMALAFSDMRKIASWRTLSAPPADAGTDETAGEQPAPAAEYELTVRDSGDIDDASARAIASLRQTNSGAPCIRLHDKLPALLLLGRHLGMFNANGPANAEELKRKQEMALTNRMAELTSEQRATLRHTLVTVMEGRLEPRRIHGRADD